jgi:hypothetical protein
MNYFAGLDVSVKNTSACIVDECDMTNVERVALHRQRKKQGLRAVPVILYTAGVCGSLAGSATANTCNPFLVGRDHASTAVTVAR